MTMRVKNPIIRKTEAVTLTAGTDHVFTTIRCHGVRCDSTGVVYLNYAGDAETDFVKHTVAVAGSYLPGHVRAVGWNGTTIPEADLRGFELALE